ncbi:MAG: glycosyltransferase family 2 protein [Clostridia bacterium]|nr:glycosyltransferase family 2 protein [Clostridia bacterium]
MKASGCIVTYNAVSGANKKKLLFDAIENLTAFSKDVDFTLYIVDNASSDGTAQAVKEYFRDNKAVKVIANRENKGFGKAHNQIIDLLESDYHFVINPDIIVKDDVIGKLCAFMESKPACGMASPDIRFPDGRVQVLAKRHPKLKYLVSSRLAGDRENNKNLREYAMLDADLSKPLQIENCSGCFFCIRTALFKELGGFDDRYFMYFEDFDLARTVGKRAEIWYCPDACVYHEWGRDSKRNSKLMLIHVQSTMKYFVKWTFKR